jgi:hypothetical protein
VERAKEHFLVALELRHVGAMVSLGELLDKDDPQRFIWLGRGAASNGKSADFLYEMGDQSCNFNSGSGSAKVVFVIGQALKGHVDNEKRTIFDSVSTLTLALAPCIKLFIFTYFNCSRIEEWSTAGQLLD